MSEKKNSFDQAGKIPNTAGKEADTTAGKDPAPDIVDGLEISINELASEYINGLKDPDEIYINNGLFVDMLKYIYKNYVGPAVLHNTTDYSGIRYDYSILNNLFNIYASLVYKYKHNKRPSILEYSIFTNLERNTIYNIAGGIYKKATQTDIRNAKRWIMECENSLTNTDSVFSIFLLKSKYGYNDNLQAIPLENQGRILSCDQLPDLNIRKIAKKDD